jgi:hypothetical protein
VAYFFISKTVVYFSSMRGLLSVYFSPIWRLLVVFTDDESNLGLFLTDVGLLTIYVSSMRDLLVDYFSPIWGVWS